MFSFLKKYVWDFCLPIRCLRMLWQLHHNERALTSQITGVPLVCSTVYPGADQRTHQRFASLAFVRGSHRRPVDFPHKGPVTRKMFPFDDVIMVSLGAKACAGALMTRYAICAIMDLDLIPVVLLYHCFCISGWWSVFSDFLLPSAGLAVCV